MAVRVVANAIRGEQPTTTQLVGFLFKKIYFITKYTMHVLDVNGIFATTFYTYNRCIESGGTYGPDARTLYTFYCKQSHIQNNKQSFTLNNFIRKGLGWGDKRIKNARAVLKNLGLIDDVVVRDSKGIIIGHYVRVNYSIDENDIRNSGSTYNLSTPAPEHDVVTARCGGMNTNTLDINNKYPILNKNTDFDKLWELLCTSKGGDEDKGEKVFMKKIEKGFSADDMIKSAALDKFEIREKVKDIMFSQKKENWIRDFCPQSEDVIESRIISILRARYERYLKGTKFRENTVTDLQELFGKEYISGLWKSVQQQYKEQHF